MSVGSAVSTSRHLVRRGGESNFAVPPAFVDRSKGFRRWAIVGEESPAVHTGFAICTLEAGGWVAAHVHSYEETVYLLEGEAELTTTEGTFRLRGGDYGVIPVGVIHSWRGLPKGARWAQMMAPQPRARFGSDTYFPKEGSVPPTERVGEGIGVPIDVRDPRTRSFGHIEASNMDVSKQTQDQLAVSASMRTALLAYSGITVKMMVDSDLGAQLSTMFMVQYEPNGVAGQHDHPFEETYLIVEGSVDATFDGEGYRMEAGDVAFAGVGFALAETSSITGALGGVGKVEHLVLAAIERDENKVRDFNTERALRLVTLKLVGYTEVIHALVSRLKDDSSILLFGGGAKDKPYPGSTMVTTVNAAVTGLVRALVMELAPVRVNAIHPGIVGDSPYWSSKPAPVLEGHRSKTPTGRLPTMADILDAALFLLTNRSVNGINLPVDGGWHFMTW